MASGYWREREEENRRHLISTEKEMAAHTGNVYEQMMRYAQKEIDSFYQRYATKEGITLAEAKQRISKADMDYLSKQAAKYVGAAQRDMENGSGTTGDYFSKQADDEMRLYNATMKINRLEFLKGEIGSHLVNGFDELNRYFDGKFTEQAMEEFRRRAVILGETVPADLEVRAEKIVNGSFRNASYSDRLWQHQDMLRLEIGRQLEQGLLRGAGSRELAREIRKIFGGSQANAERLMRTEMCRIQTEVAHAHYEKNGNTHFEYMALGMNPCPICEALDGKIFPVSDLEAGLNAPPMHPNCHCSTGPAYSEEEEKLYNDWLDSGAAAEGVPLEEFVAEKQSGVNAASDSRDTYDVINIRGTQKMQHGFSCYGRDDVLAEYSKRITPKKGYFDVSMHGTSNAVCFGEKEPNMSPHALANIIKHHPDYDGEKIRLFCCNTGNASGLEKGEYCFAEELSNAMGVTVEAPDDLLYIKKDGEWYVGPSQKKELTPYTPNQRGRYK